MFGNKVSYQAPDFEITSLKTSQSDADQILWVLNQGEVCDTACSLYFKRNFEKACF